ncbi:aldo/keto reductase [Haliscomenobacter hydrossis DSM 1100]|uniref:Aldo/keto reductase n=2 Tax=Haliscomenobacter TaxID=2349 RepID=F4L2E1_HALH1|nr:aldo/keto reductase [Haliscomenobacter hydrossis DSM 1100]
MEKMNRRTFIQQGTLASTSLMAPAWLTTTTPSGQILRTIPATGEKIPAIGMGSWLTFDVSSSERASRKEVIKKFVELGGKTIDSSPMYGRSEQVIGELAAELGISEKIWFATKVWTTGESAGKQQIQNSTRFFKTAPTLLQVHNLLDYQTQIKTLRELKENGKIRYIGATHYLNSNHEDLARLIKTESLDFIQVNLSIRSRAAENYLLPLAKDRGVAVIINRPFETGDLFQMVQNKPLPAWASEWGISTWAAFFLKYIISNPCVTCTIPATRQVAHVVENMAAAYGDLPDANARKKMIEYFEK